MRDLYHWVDIIYVMYMCVYFFPNIVMASPYSTVMAFILLVWIFYPFWFAVTRGVYLIYKVIRDR